MPDIYASVRVCVCVCVRLCVCVWYLISPFECQLCFWVCIICLWVGNYQFFLFLLLFFCLCMFVWPLLHTGRITRNPYIRRKYQFLGKIGFAPLIWFIATAKTGWIRGGQGVELLSSSSSSGSGSSFSCTTCRYSHRDHWFMTWTLVRQRKRDETYRLESLLEKN